MDKIASFTVNHLDLIPGVYVSRKDGIYYSSDKGENFEKIVNDTITGLDLTAQKNNKINVAVSALLIVALIINAISILLIFK